MGFQRDFGVCCFVLPLKFGAALIAMYVFVSAVFSLHCSAVKSDSKGMGIFFLF